MTSPANWPGAEDPKRTPGEVLALVLDTVVGVFEQAGVALPDRRYYAAGGVAADCEQLTVQMDSLFKGLPGGEAGELQRCNGPRSMLITVLLFRTSPVSTTRGGPSPESLTQSADIIAQDAWVLLDALDAIDAVGWGTGVTGEVTVQEPAGGLIGVVLSCTLPMP